jgi:hypothetical protein
MANQRVLALTTDGRITYCTCDPSQRGKGRCNHVSHQNPGETEAEFIERSSKEMVSTGALSEETPEEINARESNPISKTEVEELRRQICEIAGRDDITPENLKEVLASLDLEKQRQILEIGFESSKYFAFPVTADDYQQAELETQIHFSNMGDFGLGAKKQHIAEILGEIGDTIEEKGSGHISNNYLNGLTEDEWWSLQYATRKASVNKTVSIAAPGAEARNLFYGLSDVNIIDDCQDDSSTGILTCHMPGGFCEKCAQKSGMGDVLKILKRGSASGDISTVKIGGFVSTNLSEPLTQAYLNAIHGANDPKANQHKVIVATYDAYSSSPIIQSALEGTTTAERRMRLKEGLKQAYKDQGIDIDEYNLDIIAKKMTSYKHNKQTGRLEYVEDGELCDIVSIRSIGNRSNVFKKASLGSSYKTLSKARTYTADSNDAFEDLMGV